MKNKASSISKFLIVIGIALLSHSCDFKNDIKKIFLSKEDKTKIIDLIPIYHNGTCFYTNNKGVIDPAHLYIEYSSVFRGKYAVVGIGNEQNRNIHWGYLNRQGDLAIPAIYNEASDFNEGYAWVIPDNNIISCINESGDIIFELPEISVACCFHDGLAAIQDKYYRWGFVDKQGNVVIPIQYNSVKNFSNGLAAVQESHYSDYYYINKNGEIVSAQYSDAFNFTSKGYAVVKNGLNFGVIDKNGNYVISPQFNNIKSDKDGFLVETDHSGWGYIDLNGNILVSFDYSNINPFHGNSTTTAYQSGKWHVIDKKGSIIATFEQGVGFATSFYNNMAVISNSIYASGGYTLINDKGESIIEIPYPWRYSNGFYSVDLIDKPNITPFRYVKKALFR